MARARQTAARDADDSSPHDNGERGKIAKTQITEQVARRTGLNRKQASAAVSSVIETVVQALRAGRSVGLPGLGTLSLTATAGRRGVRPGTSEHILIPAGRKVRFRAASSLRSHL